MNRKIFGIILFLAIVALPVPGYGRWAIVDVAVASMRTEGRHSSEMSTQAIMGTPLKILKEKGEWYYVQGPDDYVAYVPSSLVRTVTEEQMKVWRKSRRVVVTAMQSTLVADTLANFAVSDLVLGCILEYKGDAGAWVKAATPDGRVGYVRKQDVADFDTWARQAFDADLIISTARSMLGMSYLWGGTSTKMADCSGFTKICYFANAIILQRDASEQALYGTSIRPEDWKEARKGDLLFWGNSAGQVTHVGLYIADGECIHCSGMVKYNSIDPDDADYLGRPLHSIRRVAGNVGTNKGIVPVRLHPWYFNKQ